MIISTMCAGAEAAMGDHIGVHSSYHNPSQLLLFKMAANSFSQPSCKLE